MACQAFVKLEALDPHIFPRVRHLILNPNQLEVPIGRASKTIEKGLLSGSDNAWFTSPVMSRDHAKLIFDKINVSIQIQDNRSMHGTTVNGEKIPFDEPRQLSVGDLLEFGTYVSRGAEDFPPCKFRIDWDICPWTNRAFSVSVPDSDDSDVEIDRSEDEDAHNSADYASTPHESPLKAVDTIDLTNDDDMDIYSAPPPVSGEGHFRDKPKMNANLVEDQAVQRAGSDSSSVFAQSIDYSVYDGEDKEELVRAEVISDNGEDSDKENGDEVEYGSLHEAEGFSYLVESSPELESPVESEDSSDSEAPSVTSSFMEEAAFDLEDELSDCDFAPISESTRLEESTQLGNAAPEFFPVTVSRIMREFESEASSLQSPTKMGFELPKISDLIPDYEENKTFPKSNIDSRNPLNFEVAGQSGRADLGYVNMAHTGNENLNETVSGESTFIGSATRPNFNSTAVPITVPERAPSPSDAAMVKPCPPSIIDHFIHAVGIHHMPSSDWQRYTARAFEDQPQKQEFFQAREENRATLKAKSIPSADLGCSFENYLFMDGSSRISDQVVRDQDKPNCNSGSAATISSTIAGASRPSVLHSSYDHGVSRGLNPHNPTFIGLTHAEPVSPDVVLQQKPTTLDFSRCEVSSQDGPVCSIFGDEEAFTDLDMTSAHCFNQSKASTLIPEYPNALHEVSRPVKIVKFKTPVQTVKRKAEEMSDVLEDELNAWGAEVTALNTTAENTNISTRNDAAPTQENAVESTEVQDTTVSKEPPTKKIKRFAEKLGYAALGGVAVGAGLFSVLVATAPDFL